MRNFRELIKTSGCVFLLWWLILNFLLNHKWSSWYRKAKSQFWGLGNVSYTLENRSQISFTNDARLKNISLYFFLLLILKDWDLLYDKFLYADFFFSCFLRLLISQVANLWLFFICFLHLQILVAMGFYDVLDRIFSLIRIFNFRLYILNLFL